MHKASDNTDRSNATHIFLDNLNNLKNLIEEIQEMPNRKNLKNLETSAIDVFDNLYIQLEKCWMIAEKGRQIQPLYHEIFDLDSSE